MKKIIDGLNRLWSDIRSNNWAKNPFNKKDDHYLEDLKWISLGIYGRRNTTSNIGHTIPDYELARMALAGQRITGLIFFDQIINCEKDK